MREKVERGGVGKSGVRLTEFEHNANLGEGFVRRLNKEATSFFFTNFSDETLAVDLWRIFAKYGRVGEVYIPNKRDKWGGRFDFVKYLEVQKVEELSKKLAEVWCDTYKLRINLSRFGRNFNNSARVQPSLNTSSKAEGVVGGRSFMEVLGGNGGGVKVGTGKGKNQATTPASFSSPLELEPDMPFRSVLERSVVGKVPQGKSIMQLQLNLCMEGYRNIRVASMREGWAIVFSDSGGDIGLAMNNKVWWDGLLEGVRPWSPIMATSKREIWVRLYGVPLQLWCDRVFSKILEQCREVLGLDEVTSGKARFDVARVKISAPLLGNIDFSQKIVSEGISFEVRVVEERGGPLEFVHIAKEEDQLGWSAAVSSCASDERGGPELAQVVGGDFCESDSDGSKQVGQGVSAAVQVEQTRREETRIFEVVQQDSFNKPEEERPILSTVHAVKLKRGDKIGVCSDEVGQLRGLSTSYLGESAGDQGVDQVGTGDMLPSPIQLEPNVTGPIMLGLGGPNGKDVERVEGDLIVVMERVVEPTSIGPMEGKRVIDKLDSLIQNSRGRLQDVEEQNFTQEKSNLSSSSASSSQNTTTHKNATRSKHRKPLSRLPFPNMLGPTCLRIVEVMSKAGTSSRRKKCGRENDESQDPIPQLAVEDIRREVVDEAEETRHNLEQVVDIEEDVAPNSGVNFLMGSDDLEDVDGFVRNRKGPEAQRSEAEQIMEIQSHLGLSYVGNKEVLVDRIVELEVRDREKMVNVEESHGFQ
jgi:hypothetical protein